MLDQVYAIRRAPAFVGVLLSTVSAIGAWFLVTADASLLRYYEPALAVLLVGVLGVFFLAAFWKYPAGGLVAIVIAGTLLSVPIPVGGATSLNLAFLLVPIALLGWVLRVGEQRDLPALRSRSSVPLLVFLSAVVISFVAGQLPWFPVAAAPMRAQLGGLAIFLFSGGIFLVSASHYMQLGWLRTLLWVFLALGSIRLIVVVIPPLDALLHGALPKGPLGSLFWTSFMAFSFAQAAVNTQLHWVQRTALFGIAALAVYLTAFPWRDWASGWLPGCFAIALIVGLFRPRLACIFFVVLVLGAALNFETLWSAIWTADQSESAEGRAAIFKGTINLLVVNPLFGLGPANHLHYSHLFPVQSPGGNYNSHNNYLDIIAQTGIVGFVAFLWFMKRLAGIAGRLIKVTPEGFEKAFVYGCSGLLGGIVLACSLGDWFVPFAYNIGVYGFQSSVLAWIFLGAMVAIEIRMLEAGSRS